jgi:hypothetical protein
MMNRLVARESEPVEFVPVPGYEDEWAIGSWVIRSRLWDYLGVLPVGLYLVLCMLLMGAS